MKYLLIVLAIALILFILNHKASTKSLALPQNAFLVDVRTTEEFSKGSVPGSVNIPLSDIPSSIDEFQGKENIVLFCRSGNRSGKAIKILEQAGVQNLTNGGGWKSVLKAIADTPN